MSTPPTLALDKALTLLSLMAADEGKRTIPALAREAGLPLATAHRLVGTFERRGYLTRIARGRYLPGLALLGLVAAGSLNTLLAATSRPILRALAAQTGLTAHLGVFEDDMVSYLVKAGRAGGDLFTREGMQLEAYSSAVGKMLLASQSPTQQARYLGAGAFVALTATTLTDIDALRRELAAIPAQGFARDECESHPWLRCIAVGVRDTNGTVIAALSLSALQRPYARDPGEHLEALHGAALALEQRLSPAPPAYANRAGR